MSNVSTTDASVIASPTPAAPTASTAADKLKAADQAAQSQSDQSVNDHAQSCPLIDRYAIEALVVGEDDKPLMDVGVELRKSPNEVLRDRTDTDGVVRFEQLVGGGYQLSLYELDKDAWKLLETAALTQPKSQGDATWQVPTPPENSAEFTHTVIQGECTAKLADRYGFFPDTVWDWSKNAKLKELRKDKNILYPDDQLVIPPRRDMTISASTGQRYRLRRKGVPDMLRIRFLTNGKPRKNVPYVAAITDEDGQIFPNESGTTDQDGYVNLHVLPKARTVQIVLGNTKDQQTHLFKIGHLDPIDFLSGAQKRLANLGYYRGKVNGKNGKQLRNALKSFQADRNLVINGKIDDQTKLELEKFYKS